MLKVELHAHTSDDPLDRIPHSVFDLIDRAAELRYDALAITLHDKQFDIRTAAPYATERGITLIPGIERTIRRRHVLLLNFPAAAAEAVGSFDDLTTLKAREPGGLVVAPHPFFPSSKSLLGQMDTHADLFDAVEAHMLFTRAMNFNAPAGRWAERHGKPMVGDGDVHCLDQLGTTYSLVDADRDPASICAAIKAGRVRVVSEPLSWSAAVRIFAKIVVPSLGAVPKSAQPARAAV